MFAASSVVVYLFVHIPLIVVCGEFARRVLVAMLNARLRHFILQSRCGAADRGQSSSWAQVRPPLCDLSHYLSHGIIRRIQVQAFDTGVMRICTIVSVP